MRFRSANVGEATEHGSGGIMQRTMTRDHVLCRWLYHASPRRRKPLLAWLLFSSAALDLVWLLSLVLGRLVWYRQRKRAELACLTEMRQA